MKMVALSLKICVRHCNVVKTMQFEPSTAVYDACRVIRERVPEAQTGQASDYGLFLSDEDPRKGIWLEAGRTLDYYMLRNGDILEYKKKQRPQKIRMLDGAVKTVMVDDSKTVGELLVTICSRIGITNYEEYSLIQETIEEKKEEGTGTLKKDRTLLRDERKMEKLKAKLHTDDDLNWLDHSRTFREQGVDENETLLLRRKFFYSDQNVDSRDPVQLNLLYVQARDDILNGSHPVSFEKACEFGGFQAQIQFGPHVEHKHKPGFLDLKEFLPKEYIKQRGAEKRIFQEHKNCGEMSEIEAKVKYVKHARSLRTYGVSFFLVKEKMKGKNKLVPRLLGITKDSVMRVDEKTKEVLQEWPLTTVKRWAASPKSFTLDFGEYQESYYSVQTTEGEQISQLIAGYIDIILKKKQSKDRFGLEGDEESTMLEESVSPKKSTILQQQFNRTGKAEHGSVALPAVMRSGSSGPETFNVGSMPSPQQQVMVGQMHRGHMPPLTSAQQALMGTINTSMHAVQQAQDDLSELDSLPPLGQDMASRVWVQNKVDESKHEIHSQVDAITAGTASVVNLTAGDPADTDYTAVGCAITTISSNLTEMSKGVKLLAALMDDDVGSGEDLLRAARTLAGAVSDLLKAVQPTSGEPRQTVLTAAGSIGQASGDLLRQIGENETDERFQDVLMSLAKAVANAAAMLVLKAKNVAQVAEDTVLQNRVIAAATQCALSTSQLVACAKVVSPTISSPVCQEQLIEAGKLVDRSVENCVRACQAATGDSELLKQVSAAASVVSQALHDLLQHVRQFASRGEPIGRYDQATDTIMCVTESIFSSMGDAGEMVRQARVLAQATSDLVNAMRSDAEAEIDMENSKKLLAAAKLLADSTARMVEAAKGAAANPENEDQQQRLREAAEGLRVATNAAAQNAIKKKIVNRLEVAAKQAAAAATQTIAASQNAAVSNKNPSAQQQLVQSCKAVADHIPQLVQGVRGSQAQAEDLSAQLALIISSQNFLQPGSKMVSSAKAAVPTVSDQAAAMQLSQCAKNLATSLAELRTASQKAHEACGPMEIDSALNTVQTLKSELQDAKMAAAESQLKPLPGETLEKCAQDLGSTSKGVGSSMAQLLTCAAQGNEHYTGVAARETAQALKTLAQAARGVAASTNDPEAAHAMLDSARDVMEGSAMLIQEAKQALIAPGDTESQQRLAQVAKAVSHSLNNCVNCLPGQKDVDVALKSIGESSKKLLVDSLPPSTKPFQEAQSELNQAAADLNQSAGEVVHATRGQSGELAAASGKFSDDFDEFLDAGIEMAGQAQTKEDQMQVIGNLKNISMASSKLLLAAKSLSVDPGAPNAKNLLAAAARAVTESINQLIMLCTQQAPGQKECDNALRELETVKGMLENPNEPVSDLSYFDCIESVMENSKAQHTHDAITEAAQLMKEAVDDIMVTLNEAASEVGLVGGMVDAIAEAMSKLDEGTPPEPKGTFVDYQTTVVKYSKAIAVTAQEMMTKSVTNPEELGGLASQMTSDYGHLALQGQMAAATAEPEEIGFQIRTRVQDLGHGCIFLVQKAGALQVCPTDSYTKRELIECARSVTEKVSLVLSALQAGNKGTQACITAATAVSGIIADLDTTIMFATAGTLNAENGETFADHRENILKTAKALVEDTKLLVSGAASTPDKLAQAAQSSAATITQLAEVVKLGAASLGSNDPETQVVLINAIKDVAKALSDLIGATKGAASKPADDPSMYQLKGAAKVMVTNVTSLLKTVKAVEDEATRGTRALEATIEYIKQELTVFQSKDIPEKTSSPEESIRMTKGITMATAKAVAAGNSCRQEDVIATANLSRKAVSDMLTACKQASFYPDVSEEVRTRALRYGTECTLGYLDLLEHVLVILQKPTPELKHQLAAFSKRVAGAVTELIQAAEAMKGTEWVDPEDPTVIAETELLGAAASIEAAAKKLEQLKPRAKPKQADETLDFEEQILEAAKSIAAATSALVKSASAAQRELVAQGKVGSIPANAADDGQWSQGLISAARMVAAATSSLCEAANASVQGHASEEKLISSAKQVAASTAQLLVACKVKADQDSEAMKRLQVMVTDAGGKILLLERAAGNAVKRASDNLVRAAQKAAFGKADDDDVVVKTKFVGGIAQIIAAQEEMLKKERELEEARKKLAQIRQQQYKFLPTELREDEG
ncbi:talin-2 [Microtus ochrogaster]|uniref:Talin-2 n=1 Tax=Microtus ochrogaster TaxID=79684 RepID=A0ABM1TYU1_MICOH|nr:talin-2 [Microtus ochrogaster]